MSNSLRTSELILVCSLLLILSSVLGIAKINASCASTLLATTPLPSHTPCLVRIEGAVAKPGLYEVPPGTPIQKVLSKSRPKRFANLKKIDLAGRVEKEMDLVVEELTEIEVVVQGAIAEPIQLTVPAGTRVCDLKSKIALKEGADLTIFKSRRMLKDGEIIEVLKKGVDENAANHL